MTPGLPVIGSCSVRLFFVISKRLLTYNEVLLRRRERTEMKTKLVAVFMEPSVHEQLRVRAFEERCSVGAVVRRAVAAYLAAKGQGH